MYLNPLEMHLHWNLCLNTASRLNKMKCLYQPSVDDSERYVLYYIPSFSRDKSPRVSNLSLNGISHGLSCPRAPKGPHTSKCSSLVQMLDVLAIVTYSGASKILFWVSRKTRSPC